MSARRAYSYLRFSTAAQADGGSLARQTRLTAEYCKKHKLVLDESLTLRDLGVSAFRGDNVREGALAGFLEACRLKRVPRGSVLIVESLDRLSRAMIRPALQLFLALQDFGITIVTHEPAREYDPASTDALALIEPLIVFARAHEESAMKSHRRRDGWNQAKEAARKNGKPMLKTCPAWMEVNGNGFKVKEKAAAAVRKIFELASEGYGVHRIVRHLIANNVPPIVEGSKWGKAYTYHILRSPAAMGTYQPNRQDGKRVVPEGPPIPNYYPPVVTAEQWERAQAAIRSRAADVDDAGRFKKGGRASRSAGRDSDTCLFSGLLHCARTRTKMHLVHAKGRKKEKGERTTYHYIAPTQETGAPGGSRFDNRIFELAILSQLKELKPTDIIDQDAGDRDEEARLSVRLADLDTRIETIKAKLIDAPDVAALADAVTQLTRDRKATAEKLQELRDVPTPGDSLKDTQSLIHMLANAEDAGDIRRRLKLRIRQLVNEMWVLIVAHGKGHRIASVQLIFRDGRQRSYVIQHQGRPQKWEVRSFVDTIAADDLDLRKPQHAKRLIKALENIDLKTL